MIEANKYWADKCKIRNAMRKAVEQWDERQWDGCTPNVRDITIKIDEFGKCVKVSDNLDTVIVCYEDEVTSCEKVSKDDKQVTIDELSEDVKKLKEDFNFLRNFVISSRRFM